MYIYCDASLLCDLMGGDFSYEACEVIVEMLEDLPVCIGDIKIAFAEISCEDLTDESVIVELDNGNVLIER